MAEQPKRPNYFQAQFLVVRDFEDEQTYHRERLHWHNRYLHEWGVVRDGLQVGKGTDRLSVSPGSAIDSLGQEIVLEDARYLTFDDVRAAAKKSEGGQEVAITIAFHEEDSPDDKYPGTDKYTRQIQRPQLVATNSPVTDGTVIILARVGVGADGSIGDPDNSVRPLASSFIPRGRNLGDIALDGALSFTTKDKPAEPQVGLDYDAATDALRVRARTKDAPALDATHLTIKRETGHVGIGQPNPARKLHITGGSILHEWSTTPGQQYGFFTAPDQVHICENSYFDVVGWKAIKKGKGVIVQTWASNGDALRVAVDNTEREKDANRSALAIAFCVRMDGNVGIGTIEPKTDLVIRKDKNKDIGPILTLYNGGGFGSAAIDFNGYDVGTNQPTARICSIDDSHYSSHLAFFTKDSGAADKPLTERLRIGSDGSVCIGAPDPQAKLDVRGDLKVSGTIYAAGHPLGYENYEIYLRGTGGESAEGGLPASLKVASVSMNMDSGRGLNTVILNPDGTFKIKLTHDLYDSQANWNAWADWVNAKAAKGDIVAAGSYDALTDAPTGGSAEQLLTSIGAMQSFRAVSKPSPPGDNNRRVPYALLFIYGRSNSLEVCMPYKGSNAHIKTTYYSLLNQGIFSGKVGIGTTDPATMLAVKASGKVIPAPTPPPAVQAYLRGSGDPMVYGYSSGDFVNIKVGDVVSVDDQQRTIVRKVDDQHIIVDPAFNFGARAVGLQVVTKPKTVNSDIFRADDMDGNAKFFIAGDGRVGIGTASPTALLTLQAQALAAKQGRLVGSNLRLQGNRLQTQNQWQGWGGTEQLEGVTVGTVLRIVGVDNMQKAITIIAKVAQFEPYAGYTFDPNTNYPYLDNLTVYALDEKDLAEIFTVLNGAGDKMLQITDGEVSITGYMSKASGAFKIDHPLDPENKYLYHSFVESPDMKNIYDGMAVLDSKGEAWVELPEWFEALNKDCRYQLTALNSAAPNLHVAQEISHGCFKIAGGQARLKVCWQVTGIRRDAYANAHRIRVEEDKPATERGSYLHPEAFGQPPAKAVGARGSNECARELAH